MQTEISCDSVIACLVNLLPTLESNSTGDLFDAGIVDSLNLIDVVVCLEQEFQLVFSPSDVTAENFTTIRNIRKTLLDIRARGSV